MVFKNEKQLKEFLMAKCKEALIKTEEKVHSIIDKCLKQFYSEFDPEEYIRTEQLLHSLVKSDIKSVSNGYEAEVYFDTEGLDYQNGLIELQSGRMGYANWDKDTILDVAMTGSYSGLPHGGQAKGTAIWSESLKQLDNVYNLLVQELKAQGIPIKKGK